MSRSLSLLQERHGDAGGGEFVDEGVQVDQEACQSVHAGDQEGIAGAEVVGGGGGESGAVAGGAVDGVGEQIRCASFGQTGGLAVEVLLLSQRRVPPRHLLTWF